MASRPANDSDGLIGLVLGVQRLTTTWRGYIASTLCGAIVGGLVLYWAQRYFATTVSLSQIRPLIKARDFDRARKLLERRLKSEPDDQESLLILAGVLLGQGEEDKCLEYLGKIPDKTAWAIEARYREGMVFRGRGLALKAEDAWARCLAVDATANEYMSPFAREAVVSLLTLYMFQMRVYDSTQLVWDWYRRAPSNDRARALIALVHMEYSPPPVDERKTALEQFVSMEKDDYLSRRALGRLHVELGLDDTTGRNLLKQCVDEQPEDVENWAAFLWCLTEQGDLESAQAAVARLPARANDNPELWRLRGLVHEMAQQWLDAARSFREAQSLEPWNREAYAHLAHVLRLQGDVPQADRFAQRVKELAEVEEKLRSVNLALEGSQGRPDAASCIALGELYEKRNRFEEARAWYEETLRLDPESAQANEAIVRLGRSKLLLK